MLVAAELFNSATLVFMNFHLNPAFQKMKKTTFHFLPCGI